jgi:outer membrane protein OmpA-like peptidoglycan-associated protein
MKIYFKIAAFLFVSHLYAQELPVQKVYFEFDRYVLIKKEQNTLLDFIKKLDTSKIKNVAIYGYCDDRGTDGYNFKLSDNRVNYVQKILLSHGIKSKKIIITEGKGRIDLDKDTVANLHETRTKNRRVDIVMVQKSISDDYFKNHRKFQSVQNQHKVGDLIILENILFEMGSSDPTLESRQQLDKVVAALQKNKTVQFEIRGHVCCTSKIYVDAVDRDTQERILSINRARNVYKYLKSKGINPYRMTYKGYGNQFPLYKGDRLDRRVEFLIVKI